MSEQQPLDIWKYAWSRTKHFFLVLFGFTCLIIGAALVILPGPGWPLVLIGLALLGSEYVWARRALRKLKAEMPQPIREELEKKRWHWIFKR